MYFGWGLGFLGRHALINLGGRDAFFFLETTLRSRDQNPVHAFPHLTFHIGG